MSALGSFDDIRRCIHVLTDGTADEELLKVLKIQDKARSECYKTSKELQHVRQELDTTLQNMADLETKLFHARRLLEVESRARREAEHERDEMEHKIIAIAELLQSDRDIDKKTKDKFAFLDKYSRSKSATLNSYNEGRCDNEIDSTESFLSDLSLTQSEVDFVDTSNSTTCHRRGPRENGDSGRFHGNKEPDANCRKSKTTFSCSQRLANVEQHVIDIGRKDRLRAITTVDIIQGKKGSIRADSRFETRSTNSQGDKNCEEKEKEPAFKRSSQPRPTTFHFSETCRLPVDSSALKSKNQQRPHNFALKTIVRVERCGLCKKKIHLGSVVPKCRDCQICCHPECRMELPPSCIPPTPTPLMKQSLGFVSDYAPSRSPRIPALLVYCVSEVESRGLTEVGLYRISGSDVEVKALKNKFLQTIKGKPPLADIDIHVICGCIKDFLRSLQEPLIPSSAWIDFYNAVQSANEIQARRSLLDAIAALPTANRDSLAFLILHFKRVAECPEVRMPSSNICRVFGPTIVGYSSPNPDHRTIYTDTLVQIAVMENLMKISTAFWAQFVALDCDKENSVSSDELSIQSDIYSYGTLPENAKRNEKLNVTYPLL